MRFRMLFAMILFAAPLLAQQRAAPPPPKNLKVLTPDVNILRVMQGVNAALGVQCTYCHVQNDFASDENPKGNRPQYVPDGQAGDGEFSGQR